MKKHQDTLTVQKGFWLLLGVLVVILAVIHRNWIFSLAPLVSGDWPYFYPDQLKGWFPFHPLWINYEGVGRGISQGNFIFLFSLYALLAKIGANFEVISRLLFFIPTLVIAPYAAFLAVRQITGSKISGIVGAFVYSLNTYFIVIQGGHMHLCVAYALAPLAYYFAVKDVERSYFWLFVVLAIMSVYDVRITIVVAMFAAVIALFHKVNHKDDLYKYVKNMAVGGVALAVFSAFWFLPMVFTQGGPFARDVFDQRALNWISDLDSFAIHHPFWSSNGVSDFLFEPTPFYMFVIPIITFLPFVLLRTARRTLLFYGAANLIFLTLLMQENSLFSGLYRFIYDNFPMMSMFRESSKMFFFTAFCSSVLIGFLVAELVRRGRHYAATGIVVVLIAALALPAKPYLTGKYIKAYQQEPISKEIREINHTVSAVSQPPARTLWVSRTPKFAANSSQTPNIDALDFGNKFWGQYSDTFDELGLAYLKEPYAPALLNFASIHHVVVPGDHIDANYRHYNFRSAEYYKDIADNWGLTSLGNAGKSTLWRNTKAKPYMYFSADNIAVDSLGVYSGIDGSPTSTYLFKDQNRKIAPRTVEIATTNTELNPFQTKYLQITPSQLASSYKVPGNEFDLYILPHRSDGTDRFAVTKDLRPGQTIVQLAPEVTAENLYADGSFESGKEVGVGDCNNYNNTQPIQNGITSTLVNNATSGNTALKVTARSHIACFFKKINNLDKKAYYYVALDYKYVSGPAPLIALSPYDEEPVKRQLPLPSAKPKEWTTFSRIIKPGHLTDNMYFNIYLPTSKITPSETIFDNIRIIKLLTQPAVYLRTHNPTVSTPTVKSINNTASRHRVAVEGLKAPRLFVFSDTFDPNWKLTIKNTNSSDRPPLYELVSKDHIIANGFANAWWIDPQALPANIKNAQGKYEFMLEYAPQKWFYIGITITTLVTIGAIGYLIYDVRRHPRKQEGYWRWR